MQVTEAPLVERQRELEALARLVDAARAGEGAAAIVEGPAGIGKSRLLTVAAESAETLEILRARASELEHDFPFGVVRQLFEPVLSRADLEERARLLAGAGAVAEHALLGSTTPGRDAGDAFAVLHGLYWFAVNLATSRPVLLIVDDAHWSDALSLRWIAFLLRRLEGVPLALLLAVRTGELPDEEALLDELLSDPSTQLVRPALLSGAGVGELVEVVLGAVPTVAFVAACQHATRGNPFLVHELLIELRERAMAPTTENAALVERLSPSSVGRALRARLRRLPRPCLQVARAVAVLGDGCELATAAALAELDAAAAAAAADALAAASILEPSRPLTFVHPLVRASVYGDLGPGERSVWHARAARVLADVRASADRIAVHLLACEPRAENQTVETLREAAGSARCRDANDVAATYLRRALREPPVLELQSQLLHELGSVELRSGEIEPAIEHLTRALQQSSTGPPRALIALELADALSLADRIPDAVDVLSDALDQLSGGASELKATVAALRVSLSYGSLTGRRRLLARSDTAAPIVGMPQATGERLLMASQAVHETFTGSAAQARALALRALGDGDLLEATGAEYLPFSLPLIALIWSHAFEDAERHLQAALGDACRRGSELGFAVTSHWRAALSWRRGALAEIETDARAPLCWRPDAPAELEPDTRPALESKVAIAGFPLTAVPACEALIERGDPAAAEDDLRAAGLETNTPTAFTAPLALEARAHVKLAQQRTAEAVALLFECGRHEDAWGIVTPSLTSWRAEAAVLLARGGEHDRARRLAGEAVRRADAFGSEVARGVALRAAALVERPPGNDGLAASVAVLRGSGAQLELARSLVELGSGLRRSKQRADAREPLREGLEVAAACGADALATRAHDELVAAGARPRRDPIESRSKLTASELRVARLAAEGMTNKEIAQALFLTEKTIEVHLTRVYRKLGIQSRSQLRRALPEEAVAA